MAKRYKNRNVGARRTSAQKAASRRNLQSAQRRRRRNGARMSGRKRGAIAAAGTAAIAVGIYKVRF